MLSITQYNQPGPRGDTDLWQLEKKKQQYNSTQVVITVFYYLSIVCYANYSFLNFVLFSIHFVTCIHHFLLAITYILTYEQ